MAHPNSVLFSGNDNFLMQYISRYEGSFCLH
jgi:hypothetical protein